MDVSIVWRTRRFVALLWGLILLGFGVVSVPAQEATPLADPEAQTQATSREALLTDTQEADAILVVTIQTGDLVPVPGACLLVERQDGTSGTYQCDGREDGAADGTVTFLLPPGDYLLVLAQAPQGYVSGASIPQSLGAGLTSNVTIDLQPGGRSVFVNTVDEGDNPVEQACFSIYTDVDSGPLGELVSASCDAPQGEPGDGSIPFTGIAPGDYIAVQSTVPSGYLPGGNTPFTVPTSGTGPIVVTVVNRIADTAGDLVINAVDEHSDPLPGACFAVFDDAGGGQRGAQVARQCDVQNGADDGQLLFTELAPGNYVIAEYHAPDGYITGAQRQVTISGDGPTIVTVPHTPGGSEVAIRTVDANTGALIRGGCFVVYRDDGTGQPDVDATIEDRCDDEDGSKDGVTLFTGLPDGDYVLWERVAPETYRALGEYQVLSVQGATASTVTFEHVPMTLVEQLVAVLIEILDEILNG